MAGFAQNSRVQVLYVPEATLGTTPASPTMVEIPVVSSTVNETKTLISSNAINANRRKKFSRHGNVAISGDVQVELSFGQYDDWLEAVMLSPWSSNNLTIGTTKKSLSVQVGSLDVNQYQLFKGVVPTSMTVEVAQDAIITTTFSVVGVSQTASSASAATAVTPATMAEPMVHKEGTIKINGVASAIVTSFSFTIDNAYAGAYVIGSGTAADLSYGNATVTGEMTVYFEDLVAYNRFLNETQCPVELVTADPAGNKYTWLMPNCQFNTGELPVGGTGPRTIKMSFEALDDPSATSLQITREAFDDE